MKEKEENVSLIFWYLYVLVSALLKFLQFNFFSFNSGIFLSNHTKSNLLKTVIQCTKNEVLH